MEKKRKIVAVVKKVNFKEAEEADDLYWANASVNERLKEMCRLRETVYGDLVNQPIKKVVFKRHIHDSEN
jgi:hypothetical protein